MSMGTVTETPTADNIRIADQTTNGLGNYLGNRVDSKGAYSYPTNLGGYVVRTIEGGPEAFVKDEGYMYTVSGNERKDVTIIRKLDKLRTEATLNARTALTLTFAGTTLPVSFPGLTDAKAYRASGMWRTANVTGADIGAKFTVFGDAEDNTPYYARAVVPAPGVVHAFDMYGVVDDADWNTRQPIMIGDRSALRVRIFNAATGNHQTLNLIKVDGALDDAPTANSIPNYSLVALRPRTEGINTLYEVVVISRGNHTDVPGFTQPAERDTHLGEPSSAGDRRFAVAGFGTRNNFLSGNTSEGFNTSRTLFRGDAIGSVQTISMGQASIGSTTLFIGIDCPPGIGISNTTENTRSIRRFNTADAMVEAFRTATGAPAFTVTRFAVVGRGAVKDSGVAQIVFAVTGTGREFTAPKEAPRFGIMIKDDKDSFVASDGIPYHHGLAFVYGEKDPVDVAVRSTSASLLNIGTLVNITGQKAPGTDFFLVGRADTATGKNSQTNLMSNYDLEDAIENHIYGAPAATTPFWRRVVTDPVNNTTVNETRTYAGPIMGYSSGQSITIGTSLANRVVIPANKSDEYNVVLVDKPNPADGKNVEVRVMQRSVSTVMVNNISSGKKFAVVTTDADDNAIAVTLFFYDQGQRNVGDSDGAPGNPGVRFGIGAANKLPGLKASIAAASASSPIGTPIKGIGTAGTATTPMKQTDMQTEAMKLTGSVNTPTGWFTIGGHNGHIFDADDPEISNYVDAAPGGDPDTAILLFYVKIDGRIGSNFTNIRMIGSGAPAAGDWSETGIGSAMWTGGAIPLWWQQRSMEGVDAEGNWYTFLALPVTIAEFNAGWNSWIARDGRDPGDMLTYELWYGDADAPGSRKYDTFQVEIPKYDLK
jgi:hypothetical protein